SQGPRVFSRSKATCAVPLCEVLTPCRGLRPHHVQRDRVGTWEVSRLAVVVMCYVPSTAGRIGKARRRVAFLTLGDQQMDAVYVAAFVEGLRRLGYVEGRNLDIDYRYTAVAVERIEPLA